MRSDRSGSTDYLQMSKLFRPLVRAATHWNGRTEEVQLSPSEKFRTEAFLNVINQFIGSYKHESSQFFFFSQVQAAAEQPVRCCTDCLDITYLATNPVSIVKYLPTN